MHTSCELAQGTSTESPLPLWERDRVRLAPAGAEESVDGERHFDSARQLAYFRASAKAGSLRAAARVPLTLSLSHKAGQLHLTSLPWRRRIFARGAAEDAEIRDSCRGDRQVACPSVAPSFVTPIRFVHSTGDLPVAPTRVFVTSAAPHEHTRPPGKDDPAGDGQSPYAIALPTRGAGTL